MKKATIWVAMAGLCMGSHLTSAAEVSYRPASPVTVYIQSTANGAVVKPDFKLFGMASSKAGKLWPTLTVWVDKEPTARIGKMNQLSWSYSFGEKPLAPGKHHIMVEAVDDKSNAGQASVDVIVEDPSPAVIVYSPEQGATVASDFTAYGVAVDKSGKGLWPTVTIWVDNESARIATLNKMAWKYSFKERPLKPGKHHILFEFVDKANNATKVERDIVVPRSYPRPW